LSQTAARKWGGNTAAGGCIFAGNCAEAIAFYQQTLGAELMFKMTFGEMPPSAQIEDEGEAGVVYIGPEGAVA
jgi:predicted enzyme related to lactoylglutathione lyase